jgi:nucleotide-binding universal stress UspA family protein
VSRRDRLQGLLLAQVEGMTVTHILVATDFSESAGCALDMAVELAHKFDATLTLAHCWEAPSYSYGGALYVSVDSITPIERAANRCLEEALVELKKRMPEATSVLRSGRAWEEILLAAAESKADLIVLGTHGRRGLGRLLLGSVAEKVVRMARLPVLTVHAPALANDTQKLRASAEVAPIPT